MRRHGNLLREHDPEFPAWQRGVAAAGKAIAALAVWLLLGSLFVYLDSTHPVALWVGAPCLAFALGIASEIVSGLRK